MMYPMVLFPVSRFQGYGVIIDALDILCAQLTRDLFAIAKFLFIHSSSEHIGTLAVIGELYACKFAFCMAYFGNGTGFYLH